MTYMGKESKKEGIRTSLVVQWLRLHASIAEGAVSIPGQGTKILHSAKRGQKMRREFEKE